MKNFDGKTIREMIQRAGIDSIQEMESLCDTCERSLYRWHHIKPERFEVLLLGCVIKKQRLATEESPQPGEPREVILVNTHGDTWRYVTGFADHGFEYSSHPTKALGVFHLKKAKIVALKYKEFAGCELEITTRMIDGV